MSDRAVPNLPSRSFDATLEFYGHLGFSLGYRDDSWMILRRGSLQLEFFLFPELNPSQSSFMCSVRVADVDALYASAALRVPEAATGIPRLHPIALESWGQRVGYLVDLDGTQLALIEES